MKGLIFQDLNCGWKLLTGGGIKRSISIHCLPQWILDQNNFCDIDSLSFWGGTYSPMTHSQDKWELSSEYGGHIYLEWRWCHTQQSSWTVQEDGLCASKAYRINWGKKGVWSFSSRKWSGWWHWRTIPSAVITLWMDYRSAWGILPNKWLRTLLRLRTLGSYKAGCVASCKWMK